MYKITHFRKTLMINNARPYGIIRVYFGPNSSKNTGRISLNKFLALSSLLENDEVVYDPNNHVFLTKVEPVAYATPPNGEIE